MSQKTLPVSDGLFTYDENSNKGKLIISECKICKHTAFPKIEFCPECAKDTMVAVELDDEGTLISYTEIHAPPPGYKGEVPYSVGIVEFSNKNIRILGLLAVDNPKILQNGQSMRIVVEPSYKEDELTYLTYKFQPVN